MKRIEALALAISHANRVLEPDSEAFQTLNPGLLHAYTAGEDKINEQGIRVFETLQGGLRALISNLEAKCEGRTRANGDHGHLSPNSTLRELCMTFRGVRPRVAIEYLQDALSDKAIGEKTKLVYFVEES
jgi:hypothetical protein